MHFFFFLVRFYSENSYTQQWPLATLWPCNTRRGKQLYVNRQAVSLARASFFSNSVSSSPSSWGHSSRVHTHQSPQKLSRPSERQDSHLPLFDPAKTDSSHNLDRENSPLGSGKFRYIHIYSTNLYIF